LSQGTPNKVSMIEKMEGTEDLYIYQIFRSSDHQNNGKSSDSRQHGRECAVGMRGREQVAVH
jgi:hypothetical protein